MIEGDARDGSRRPAGGERAIGRPAANGSGPGLGATALALAGLAFAPGAQASFLPPEMMDKAAMYLAWFIIVAVPIGGIVLFWMVHVLPEKIAHKRHHPQRDAIHTLCLLSLVFGGLLWPIAWLWAYVKPVGYRVAYGTDKHEDYYPRDGRGRRSPARCSSMRSRTCATNSTKWPPRGR